MLTCKQLPSHHEAVLGAKNLLILAHDFRNNIVSRPLWAEEYLPLKLPASSEL